MPRDNLLDDLLEVLKRTTFEFIEERIAFPMQQPPQPRVRRVSKAPKVKKAKAERAAKPAKREAQGPTLYEILGVDAKAEPEVIEAAWKAKARLYHPDRAPISAVAIERMKAVNAAHDVLKDPIKRREYDAKLRKGTHD